jgi:hypothetical protein
MAKPTDTMNTSVQRAARSTTLLLGVTAVLLLLIALFGVLWITLDRQNQAVQREDLYGRAVIIMPSLLRPLDEMAAPEGSSASRSAVTEAFKRLIAVRPTLDQDAFNTRPGIIFNSLEQRTRAYIAENNISFSNTAAVK